MPIRIGQYHLHPLLEISSTYNSDLAIDKLDSPTLDTPNVGTALHIHLLPILIYFEDSSIVQFQNGQLVAYSENRRRRRI